MDELQAALARIKALENDNAALVDKAKRQANARIMAKVSTKGAVSVYGLGRFPLTLYATQWRRLADYLPSVMEFIESEPEGIVLEKPAVEADK